MAKGPGGRPKKPTQLAILEDTRKDRINFNEPKSPKGLGPPPDHFDSHGVEAWNWYKSRVEKMEIGTEADEGVAYIFATSFSDVRRAQQSIDDFGIMVESVTEKTTRNGSTSSSTLKGNPACGIKSAGLARMAWCLSQSGMSPSSRASLKVDEDDAGDMLQQFMAQRNAKTNGKGSIPKAGRKEA
jgi:P27 family predicted phage terminase small subunit